MSMEPIILPEQQSDALPPRPQIVIPVREPTPEEVAQREARLAEQQAAERAAARAVRREQLGNQARVVAATALELAGIAGLAWAGFTFAVWLGLTIASVGLIIVGVAMDPPQLPKLRAAKAAGKGTE